MRHLASWAGYDTGTGPALFQAQCQTCQRTFNTSNQTAVQNWCNHHEDWDDTGREEQPA